MSGITYRKAVPADAARLASLGRRTFTETFGHLYTPENLAAFLLNHDEAKWRDELADPDFEIRLAEDDGEPVAYVKVGPPSLPFEPRGPSLELRQLYVLQPWQGGGVAAELMGWAIEQARMRGARDLYLSVFIDNHRARRFYDRHGFEVVGQFQFMVGNHADDERIMRLALAEEG
jgi:diamine N-acetyltransferase